MFCYQCGAKLDDDARFCHNCGTAVLDSPKAQEKSGFGAEWREGVKEEVADGFRSLLVKIVVIAVAVGITFVVLKLIDRKDHPEQSIEIQATQPADPGPAVSGPAPKKPEMTLTYLTMLKQYGYEDVSIFEGNSSIACLSESEYGLVKTEYVHDGTYVTDQVLYFYSDVDYETEEEIHTFVRGFYDGAYLVGDGYYVTIYHYDNLDQNSGLREYYGFSEEEDIVLEPINVATVQKWLENEAAICTR